MWDDAICVLAASVQPSAMMQIICILYMWRMACVHFIQG